jgi:hypothetical protein
MVKMIDGIVAAHTELSVHPLPFIRDSLSNIFVRKASIIKALDFARDAGIPFDGNILGQLSKKLEAAGKVRVFAIVDG